jgi:hypothetical protein
MVLVWMRRRLCTVRWWQHHALMMTYKVLRKYRHHINGGLISSIAIGTVAEGARMLDVMFVFLAVFSEF